MTAGTHTVKAIAAVMVRHVDRQTIEKIVDELLDIPGNASFRETIRRLADELRSNVKVNS
jgi:hypothetical protein